MEDIIIKETSKTVRELNLRKIKKTPSVKIEKSETAMLEKIDRNGTPKPSSESLKMLNVGVKIEKTDSAANVKVEKIAKEEKKVPREKRTLPSSATPSKLKTIIKSNNAMRDKIREMLQEALSKVSEEANEDQIDQVNACDPIRIAVTVESVLFEKWGHSNGAQKVKYRSLIFNLKDPNNPDFSRKVLLGDVKPERLVNMSTSEMAIERRKQENEKIKEKALFECERGVQPKATSDQFKCGKCGQRKCTYYQMQTRSADEPMTTYVTCVVCNNRWRFC